VATEVQDVRFVFEQSATQIARSDGKVWNQVKLITMTAEADALVDLA